MTTALTINLNIVPVSPRDREAFTEMAERHFRELNAAFTPHADWKENYFQNITENPRMFLRWVQVDGKRAGFILFGIENHRFLPRQTGAIYELYIEPGFRRSGIGRSCGSAAIREIQTYSPSKVQLEIMEGNSAARRLWTSLGFEKVSERWVLKDLKQ